MSRQNKVNPGTYTQRGRLTQDDAARELRNQNAIGSPHTWTPVNTKARQTPAGDAALHRHGSADNDAMVKTSAPVATRPTSRMTKMTATKTASSTATAKAAKAKTGTTRRSKRTTSNSKTGKAVTTAAKRRGGAAPRAATKRSRS